MLDLGGVGSRTGGWVLCCGVGAGLREPLPLPPQPAVSSGLGYPCSPLQHSGDQPLCLPPCIKFNKLL